MSSRYLFYLLFFYFGLSAIQSGWSQEKSLSWPTLYPVHPHCVDSIGIATKQNACTEAVLQQFFLQQVDWSKVLIASSPPARFYLNIDKNGALDGYGIRDCPDFYLAQRFLAIAEKLPLSNWLPAIQNAEPRGAQMLFTLHWHNHQLDSVRLQELKPRPLVRRWDTQVDLQGNGAEFPDGHEAFSRYLNAFIQLPQDSTLQRKISGEKLPLRLTVERDGTVGKIDLLKPLHSLVDSLVLTTLRQGPKWGPGHSNSKNQIRVALCTLVFYPYRKNTGQEIVDRPIEPSFKGGQALLLKFLAQHISPLLQSMNPDEVQEGMVLLQLFFNPDGSIYHARILRSHHPVIDKGIMEMVKKMPRWDVYRDRVQPKNSFTQIPIRIKLE